MLNISTCDSIASTGGRAMLRPRGDLLSIEGVNGDRLHEADGTTATAGSLLGGRLAHYYKELSLPAGRHVVWVRASRPETQTYSLQGIENATRAGTAGAPPALVSSLAQGAQGPSIGGGPNSCLITFMAEAGHNYTMRIVKDQVVIRDDTTKQDVSRDLRCKTYDDFESWPSFRTPGGSPADSALRR